MTGRSILTSGAATTIRSAVTDYLRAEDARDEAGTGEVSEATEQALGPVSILVNTGDRPGNVAVGAMRTCVR